MEPPTDSSGRVIEPAVLPDGTPLKITPAGDYIDPFGNVVLKDDDGTLYKICITISTGIINYS